MKLIELDNLSDILLDKIRRRSGHHFNLMRLASALKVTSDDITQAVKRLCEVGYDIKTDKENRPAFINAPDSFFPAEIQYGLKTKMLGHNIHAFRKVQSTNTTAHQLADNKAPDGTLVISEIQTKGRGRMGRSWHSIENVGLYCSIILYPKINPNIAPGLSLITAVALAETIAKYENLDIGVKWPNDVLISGKKTAGILTELSAEFGRTHFVIIGVGVNINHRKKDFPEELRGKTTSLRLMLKQNIRRVEFLQKFLLNLETEYFVFKNAGLAGVRKKILRFSSLINKEITLKMGRKSISGRVIDINESGQLVMETKDGIRLFYAGEVSSH